MRMPDSSWREAISRAREWGLLRDLTGRHFVITGTLSMTRPQMIELIQTLGGKVDSKVNISMSQTLIYGEGKSEQSSKTRAAMEQGVPVLCEEEFCEMILPTLEELVGDSHGRSSPS